MMSSIKCFGKLVLSCLILATVACGSGEPGPAADASKTPAQVKEAVKGQDVTVLEKAVASYKAAIDETKVEAKKLEDEIKEAGSKALDGLLGDGKVDEIKADVEAKVAELETELKALKDKVADMVAKLKVYTEELASRV